MSHADYAPNTPEELREMLTVIGIAGIEDLFGSIPPELRAAPFNLPEGVSEFELMQRMRELAATNVEGITNFIGGGFYDHLIPAVVEHLIGRGEFYTAYTPYQPECSQGTLQALFEYQSAICALTGMEVSNASLYDGGTALAEAALMALRITGRRRIIIDGAVNPFYRQILATYLAPLGVELVEIAPQQGIIDRALLTANLDAGVAAVIVQNPNFFGSIDDIGDISSSARSVGALLIASVYPVALGLLKSPGEFGADIVTGDGQSLGNPLNFGGPSFGLIATRKQYIRNLPGRIVGETADGMGRRGFVLTLQAREQHIRRERATSNICSNQSLCAVRGLIFLCSLGKDGLVNLARLNRDKAEYAKGLLRAIEGVEVWNVAPTFNEFTLQLPRDAAPVVEKLLARGIAAGIPLGEYYPGLERCLVVTVTEKRSRREIDAFVTELEEAIWN
ncbi:MAG: aminomethyl-transferring glycine dehydrogenase subunit GcvPA [Deltaproteobacteria bacterium]